MKPRSQSSNTVKSAPISIAECVHRHTHHPRRHRGGVMHNAVLAGHLACVAYALSCGAEWGYASSAAAERGDLDALVFCHKRGCPMDEYTCGAAARVGSLECLQYAHAHGATLASRYVCMFAASGGHLACLQYAHKHGAPVGAETTRHAVMAPTQDCLDYLLQCGCDVDITASNQAARFGVRARLERLHAHGCPIDATTYYDAARMFNQSALEFLISVDCPRSSRGAYTRERQAVISELHVQHDCRRLRRRWAARTIAAGWLRVRCDPQFALCRRALHREFARLNCAAPL